MIEEKYQKKLLAIDYGKSKLGMAFTDGESCVAHKYGILFEKNLDEQVNKIANIANKLNADCIILGLPLNADGKDTETSLLIREFGIKLHKLANLSIMYWNEIMTTQMASNNMLKKHGAEDSEAARIILQEYLDNLK